MDVTNYFIYINIIQVRCSFRHLIGVRWFIGFWTTNHPLLRRLLISQYKRMGLFNYFLFRMNPMDLSIPKVLHSIFFIVENDHRHSAGKEEGHSQNVHSNRFRHD